MITVDNCCKCVSLRVGSIVIGAIEIVWAFAHCGVALAGYGFGSLRLDNMITQIIFGVVLLLWLIAAALLLAGIFKNEKKFVFVYLIIIIILVLLLLILGVVAGVLYITNNSDSVVQGIVLVIVWIVLAAIQIYLWIVVFSFYKGGGE